MTQAAFNDTLMLRAGLEYKAKLPCGHVVHYISKETARAYSEDQNAEVIAPVQGVFGPVDEHGKPLFY